MEQLSERIARIRDDHEHGSRWLVRSTIELLRDLATQSTLSPEEQLQELHQAGRELAQVRPAMAALAGAVGRILAAPGGSAGMARSAEQLLQEYAQALARMTTFARPHLHGTIMIHSLSGTVLEVVSSCIPPVAHIILLEGRPLYEGRAAAQHLLQQPVQLTLITDAQAAIFLSRCHAVVVGADSILADGSILNKAGTALLAWAARGQGVPFYVLAETLKISPHPWSGDLSLLEEKSPQEVWSQPPSGVTVRNFYFDHTPAELITEIISEKGPLSREQIQQQAAKIQQQLGTF
ncbi:MAG TPA: translation initiation factor eIF-2B [Ktedonobacteraceae bacterium]|nr:translation initiation factor eIF-2B [Ktedonobacteraceae bacterium]